MQRAVSDSDVIIILPKNMHMNCQKKNLKASEFRIHPSIIDRAIDSLEE